MNNPTPLNLICRRATLDFILEGYFLKEVLLAALPRPVRQLVFEDGQQVPPTSDALFITLDDGAIAYLRAAADAGCRNLGVLHMGDEYGQHDRSFYAQADYVLRHYWFPQIVQAPSPTAPPVLWVPNGFRTGVGPIDPARTLPIAERQIEAFFAGALHESKPQHERQNMLATIHQAQLPFVVYATPGFAQGFGPLSYAGFLANSKFALVPGGNSPETIRLYDALEHGAIPILLDSPFVHATGALAALGPPPLVLFDQWHSLPKVYADLSSLPASRLEDRRCEVLDWWTRFKSHQQTKVRDVIEASFAKAAV